MEIPLQARVECRDGVCGRSVAVLMNPVVDQVTHLVVRTDSAPHAEYIVPMDVVSTATQDAIVLRCSQAELEKMDPFVEAQFIRMDARSSEIRGQGMSGEIPVSSEIHGEGGPQESSGRMPGSSEIHGQGRSGEIPGSSDVHGEGGPQYYWPYATYERTDASYESAVSATGEQMHIPPGELAVRRGTRVEATDGYVGNVDEFLVDPDNGHVTHLVMREGHLWGQKDVTIPLSALGDTRGDTVFLKLDKHQIESLPTMPVHRR